MATGETAGTSPTRGLAAIMFSDVTGYTRIMGRDEQAGLRALAEHRELLRSLLPRFNGRMVGEIGDGTLSSFYSAIDAVNCAREVQSMLRSDPDLSVRIGIHIGDVVFSDNTVLGDGVNVASRIHALAAPGGICISANVFDEIRNKPGMQVRDLGEQRLKNVSRPIRVYALQTSAAAGRDSWTRSRYGSRLRAALIAVAVLVAAVAAAVAYSYRARIASTLQPRAPAETGEVTVAVLPFANLSADKSDEYFSDGMTDEIRGDLAKIAGLQVTARTSSYAFKGQNLEATKIGGLLHVRNLLEGSVQRSADKVRIEVELIDATSGFSIWSERYDRKMADVFAIQSDIAQGVADKLRVTLLPGEKARVERKPTDNLEAYNLYLQGNYYLGLVTGAGSMKALDSFSAAMAKDPKFAQAYVGRALAYGQESYFGAIPPREGTPKLKADIERALALDDTIGEAHGLLAYFVYFAYEWDWPAAEREFQVALKLDPDNPVIHYAYGRYLVTLGRFDGAVREHQRARELDPQNPLWVGTIGDAWFCARKYDRALQYNQQTIAMSPNFWGGYFGRGWTLLKLKGDTAAFVRDEERALALADSPQAEGTLAYAYALAGRTAEARSILRDKFEQVSKQRYVDRGAFAGTYFVLGDKDRAFELLDQAYQDRSAAMTLLNWPYNDAMRSDPRFTALVNEVGLPH